MENKNKHILHYVIGFVLGIAVTHLFMMMHHGKRDMVKDTTHNMDMSAMMAEMNANLADKKGDDFDKAFISEMIVHHEGAVDMAELALTNANHAEIKTLAKAIITAQTSEIAQMKAWLTTWYGAEATVNPTTGGAHH